MSRPWPRRRLTKPAPSGRHYLPATAPLFGAGSRTPAKAGLYHYTTRTNQMKEGEEAAGHRVNTGLHYAATAGPASAMPGTATRTASRASVETWHGDGGSASTPTARPTGRMPRPFPAYTTRRFDLGRGRSGSVLTLDSFQ